MHFSALLALAGAVAVQAVNQGFNYGSTNTDGSAKGQTEFENEFNRAKSLQGTNGDFTSARLYTMIQAGTANDPISAIPAAISTKTGLLLGLWASAGQEGINNEITALKRAISEYGSNFIDLIEGISVGSEDLYRDSVTGIINKSGIGATPDELVSYINQVRSAISGTAASSKSIGHVDTWTAWVNGSNSAVIGAVDWLGMDGYPYFQNTQANSIENAESLFFDSYNATVGVSNGKPVWITETGWPVSGPTENLAVPSTANAEIYWQDVACRILGNINTYWYTLQDASPTTPSPSFGIVPSDLNAGPLYDLTCKSGNSGSSSSPSASSSQAASSSAAVSSSQVAASSAPVSSSQPTTVSSAAPTTSSDSSSAAVTSSPATSIVTSAGSSATQTAPAVHTFTTYSTTLITVTACPSSCTEAQSTAAATTSSMAAPASSSCPANLNGPYQYPHLIVPVDSANPDKAYGTQYDGTISPTISTIFNFDIPASYAGKTCSLVFLFPEKSQLETSNYTFNNKGGITVHGLDSPATQQTTYNSVPAANELTASISNLKSGNSYNLLTEACPAGQRISFEFSSTDGLDLTYFQDYNPSPLGAYITVC